jgi:hypothetical protein
MHFPKSYDFLLPILVGTFIFLLVIGTGPLNPENIAWISSGDPKVHYLGWAFFRNDTWHFPPGLNPNYGLEISSSIVYSDSIPLLAFLFKIFNRFLPETFQYFGIWLFLCFVLQAYFGWLIVGLITENSLIKILGCALITFSPPLMWRIHPNIGHLSLAGHFLILWGIYITINKRIKYQDFQWAALLCIAALVHAYFLASILLLWGIVFFFRLIDRQSYNQSLYLNSALIFCVTLLTLWLAGYFEIGSSATTGGYGKNAVNLLAIFDPIYSNEYGRWSQILPNIPGDELSHEGFNYLGLGFIFLLTTIVILFMRVIKLRETYLTFINTPLIITAFLLLLFSLSNNIGIGPLEFNLALPHKLEQAAGIFRSSGRMFWLPFYVIVLSILFVILKILSIRTILLILVIALLLQVTDSSYGWLKISERTKVAPSSKWSTTLHSKFWEVAPDIYSNIIRIQPSNSPSNWGQLAYFAQIHNMKTNSVALARMDASKLALARANSLHLAESQSLLDVNTIYIIEAAQVPLFEKAIDPSMHSLFFVDGFYVLAPQCRLLAKCNNAIN